MPSLRAAIAAHTMEVDDICRDASPWRDPARPRDGATPIEPQAEPREDLGEVKSALRTRLDDFPVRRRSRFGKQYTRLFESFTASCNEEASRRYRIEFRLSAGAARKSSSRAQSCFSASGSVSDRSALPPGKTCASPSTSDSPWRLTMNASMPPAASRNNTTVTAARAGIATARSYGSTVVFSRPRTMTISSNTQAEPISTQTQQQRK